MPHQAVGANAVGKDDAVGTRPFHVFPFPMLVPDAETVRADGAQTPVSEVNRRAAAHDAGVPGAGVWGAAVSGLSVWGPAGAADFSCLFLIFAASPG